MLIELVADYLAELAQAMHPVFGLQLCFFGQDVLQLPLQQDRVAPHKLNHFDDECYRLEAALGGTPIITRHDPIIRLSSAECSDDELKCNRGEATTRRGPSPVAVLK